MSCQVPHEHPGAFRNGIWTYTGIHQDKMFIGAHKETSHLDRKHSVVVQELGVLEPILVGLVEQRGRWDGEAPIRDTLDRHGPYLHAVDRTFRGCASSVGAGVTLLSLDPLVRMFLGESDAGSGCRVADHP